MATEQAAPTPAITQAPARAPSLRAKSVQGSVVAT